MSTQNSNHYSIDDACADIDNLNLLVETEFSIFCEAVLQHVIPVIRTDYKIELLSLWPKNDITDYFRLLLTNFSHVTPFEALMMAEHAIKEEVYKYVCSRNVA